MGEKVDPTEIAPESVGFSSYRLSNTVYPYDLRVRNIRLIHIGKFPIPPVSYRFQAVNVFYIGVSQVAGAYFVSG